MRMITIMAIISCGLFWQEAVAQKPSKKAEDFTLAFLSAMKESDLSKIEPLVATTADYTALQGQPMPGAAGDSAKAQAFRKFRGYMNELLEISKGSQLNWQALKLDSIHESSINPTKVKFVAWLSQQNPERSISLEFKKLILANGAYKFSSGSGMGLDGNDPVNTIAKNTLEALSKQDVKLFLGAMLPSQEDFDKLYKAVYAESPELLTMNTVDARSLISKKLEKSFNTVMAQMTEQKIDPSSLRLSWAGRSITRRDKYTDFSVNCQFISGGDKSYRIELNFCNWLNENPYVFVPGELAWKGEVQQD